MATWAILLFIATMLVLLLPFLLFSYPAKDPSKTRRFLKYARVWMGIFLPLIGCPMRVRGRSNFEKENSYVVICNHNSFMDVPVSCTAVPGTSKTIAKIEMAKTPIFGMMYRTGSVLVDRKSDASRKESYVQMKKVLDMGMHMCIYPEGTRNKTGQPLKSFHDGAFRLSIDTGKALMPAIIFNTKKVLPASKPFFLSPHKLEIHFLPAVAPAPDDTVESLKTKLFRIMTEYYVANAGKL